MSKISGFRALASQTAAANAATTPAVVPPRASKVTDASLGVATEGAAHRNQTAAAIGLGRPTRMVAPQAIGDAPDELAAVMHGNTGLNAYYQPEDAPHLIFMLDPDAKLTARERVFKRVEKSFGPLIDGSAAPLLSSTLLEVFGNLAAAQDARAASHDVLSVNELFFTDTPVENAVVHPHIDRGVRLLRALSFVSTGIMRTALGIDSGELESNDPRVAARALAQFNLGLSAIAGLCAHELAHPLDDVDGDGYAKSDAVSGARHAIELKADIQGMVLLRDAGYPVSGLRAALDIFTGRDTANIGVAAASTHPPTDLRMATLEMAETLARYELGPATVTRPFDVDLTSARAMAAELRGIEAYRERWVFEPTTSYDATLARLTQLNVTKKHPKRPDGWAKVEQNRLLVRLGEQLAERESNGTAPVGDEVTQLIGVLASLRHPVADTAGLKRLMTPLNVSEEFASAASFRRRAETSTTLGSAEALLALSKLASPQPTPFEFFATTTQRTDPPWTHDILAHERASGGGTDFQTALDVKPPPWLAELELTQRFGRLLPENIVANLMGEKLPTMFNGIVFGDGSHGWAQSDAPTVSLLASLPITVRMRLAAQYVNRHLRDAGPELATLGACGQLGVTGLLPLEGSKERPRATRLRGTVRVKAHASVSADYRAAMAKLWQHRGAIAFGNAMSDERIDWHLVAELGGVDSRDVDGDVRLAVSRHLDARDASEEPTWPVSTMSSLGHPPTWLDDRLARRYLAHLRAQKPEISDQRAALGNAVLQETFDEIGREIDENTKAKPFLKRLKNAFESTGVHNVYAEELIAAVRAGAASKRESWLAELFTVYSVIPLPLTPIASERALDLILDTLEKLLPPAERLVLLPQLVSEELSATLRTTPRLVHRYLAFRNAAGGSGGATELILGVVKPKLKLKPESYMPLVAACGRQLAAEVSAVQSAPANERANAVRTFSSLLDSAVKADAATLEGLHPLKEAVIELARTVEGLDVTALHAAVARTGPTRATDAYCVDFVLPLADQAGVEKLLRGGVLYSDQLRLDLAIGVLESRWPAPGMNRAARNLAVAHNLERFNAYAPEASLQRDVFLEQLAWRFGFRGRELNAFVEDQKSANWRRGDPLLVRLGSAASTAIAELDRHTRQVFIDALVHRKRGEPFTLPREVSRAIKSATKVVEHVVPGGPGFEFVVSRHTPNIAAELERHISDASANELIPLIAMTIRSGTNALSKQAGYPNNVMHLLGCQPGDDRASILEAFLETVPEHERAVTLAYFMSQQGETHDYVSGFEVFDAPGIMVGQLAHTFGLVEGAQALKHDAKRLSKAQIHDELGGLSREARAVLEDRVAEYVGVVGSAKLKTVVEVTLDDGRRAALMVRRPNVAAKVDANFAQGRAFVANLERRGVKLPLRLVRALIDASQTQMKRELDFRSEAKRLGEMRTTLTELNGHPELAPLLGGWKFAVPQLIKGMPVEESMLVTEFAEGLPFSAGDGEAQLDPQTRAALGPALVKASLMLLFRYGTFEADRHLGNWRFDPSTKTISFIDIGQLTDMSRTSPWREDDTLVMARFVAAWGKKDATALADAFGAMSSNGAPDRAKLVNAIAAVLQDGTLEASAQLARLAEAALESGVELEHRFLFGGVKGLMVLASEGYVDPGTFAQILGDEVKGTLKRKAPAVAVGALKGMLAGRGIRVA